MSHPHQVPTANNPTGPFTLAHVTHEAVEQLGGIGTVLEGLMCSPAYQQHVKRSILVGPTSAHMTTEPHKRLGEHGTVLYSSIDRIDDADLGGRLRPVEWAFNVKIIYGTRRYAPPGQGRTGAAEVLLIDVLAANPDRLNVFKLRLWERFGLDSGKYEKSWDYEEYVRLAEPAFYALQMLLGEADRPCVLFSHEFMGMPTALQAILDGGGAFRTVFHAHECATARRLVERHPGHDTMFYNVLRQSGVRGSVSEARRPRAARPPAARFARTDVPGSDISPCNRPRRRRFVEDVFGPQDQCLRHALVSRAHLCDGVIAVGDHTKSELHFLNERFADKAVDLVYNGLPAMPVSLQEKKQSRAKLVDYATKLVGYEPHVLMSHVARPVISKGIWRDMKVCHHLDGLLSEQNKKAVLLILTSAGGVRGPRDVRHMEEAYGWPRRHQEGYPDLVGPEIDIHRMAAGFNDDHDHVQVVLVNQFGWSRDRIGRRLPVDMHMGRFRTAVDVELGMATYEPFGISPLEPLAGGAVCVISNVCGCENFVRAVADGQPTPNVLTADFTRLDRPHTIEELQAMTDAHRDRIEEAESARVAGELIHRLPFDDGARRQLIASGQALVRDMGWDQVIETSLLPLLKRICSPPTLPTHPADSATAGEG